MISPLLFARPTLIKPLQKRSHHSLWLVAPEGVLKTLNSTPHRCFRSKLFPFTHKGFLQG